MEAGLSLYIKINWSQNLGLEFAPVLFFSGTMTFSSNRSSGKSLDRKRRSKARVSASSIKCRFCGNTFLAQPEEAVCKKCGCPANRPLNARWRAASLLVPPVGIANAAVMRPHSPLAAKQGLIFSGIGIIVYGGLYSLLHFGLKVIVVLTMMPVG